MSGPNGWDRIKERASKNWGQLTDDDLTEADGDYDRAVDIIQDRTGETVEDIERKLDNDFEVYRDRDEV